MSIVAKRVLGTVCWFPCNLILYGLWNLGLHDPVRTWLLHIVNTGAPHRDAVIVSLILATIICTMFFPYYWLWFIYGREINSEPRDDQEDAKNLQSLSSTGEKNSSTQERIVQTPKKKNNEITKNNKKKTISKEEAKQSNFEATSAKSEKTLYGILGVSERAKDVDIFAAHRKLVQRWHSDKHFGYRRATDQRLIWLNRARDVLTDSKKRASYDRQLSNHRSSK